MWFEVEALSMFVYTPLYFEIVGYITMLCAFIPVWVFLVLG